MATLTADAARDVFHRYLAHHARCELEGVLALFESDAIVEDPVGAPACEGIDAIRDFYAATHRRNGPLSLDVVGPVLFGGFELAAHVKAAIRSEGAPPPMDVIYLLAISPAGRIMGLRAWY